MRIFINLCTKILPKPKIPPKSLDSSQSIVTKTWNLMFGRYLLATNVISSGVIMCAGDLMSQKLENYMVIGDDNEQNDNNDDGVIRKRKKVKKEIDWERMGKRKILPYSIKTLISQLSYLNTGYMFIAGALQGPINHYVYKYLDIFLPKSDLRTVAKKIAIDQFMMSPVCIVAFFYSAGLLEKKTVSECTAELKEKALTVYTVSRGDLKL